MEETQQEAAPLVKDIHQPEDTMAAFFKQNENKLSVLIKKLGLKQLRRATMNAASGGLMNKEYILKSDDEKSFAYTLNDIITQRVCMQLAVEMERAAEEAAKKEQSMKELVTPVEEKPSL